MIKLVDIGVIVLSSGLFLLCYLLFLRKEKYHQLNRAYLLFSLTFSSLLPFIRFSLPEQPLMPNTQSFLTTVTEAPAIPFGMVLYVAGAALFFILFLLRLFKVLKQIIGKHFIELNGLKVMDNPEQKVPFSFFHYVVVDSTTFELDELDLVLRHEAAHAQQWHTLDILFVELLGVICWFNPFVWAYKSALKSQHEYAADAAVIHSNVPRNDYFDLILKQIRHQTHLSPVHSFSATAVKSRIRMMMATVPGRRSWMRYLSVIPMSAFLVVGNSLLASSKNIPSFMENVVVPAEVSQSHSEYSDKEVTVPTENVKAKRVVRHAKKHSQHTAEVSQPNVLESQSWLSTQYGDPVEFYDEAPDTKQEEHYNVIVTGDAPQIYQVSVSETP
jgi:hypothetical protein